MKKILFSCVCMYASTVLAQDLDEVVITATKTPEKKFSTALNVSVVPDSVIARYASVAQVLNAQVGFYIVGANGPLGSNQTVFSRGTADGNTLFLMNGLPISDASFINQNVDLNTLSTSQIERIEIIKGSQSTLYGSEAVGAVVNIITKKHQSAKKFSGSVQSWAGSQSTFQNAANLSGILGKGWFTFHVQNTNSKGVSVAANLRETDHNETDAFHATHVSSQMQFPIKKTGTLKLNGQWAVNQLHIDLGVLLDDADYTGTNQTLNFGGDFQKLMGKNSFNARVSHYQTDRGFTNDSISYTPGYEGYYLSQNFGSKTTNADVFFRFESDAKFKLTTGIDGRIPRAQSSGYYVFGGYKADISPMDQAFKMAGFYATGQLLASDKFQFEGGGRLNYHSTLGWNQTFNLGGQFLVSDLFKLVGHVGTGFRTPSIYQLYSEYGNADLKPEETVAMEAGFEVKNTLKLKFFNRNTQNVIFFQSLATAPFGKYINLLEETSSGIELEAKAKIAKIWMASGSFSVMNGTSQSQSVAGIIENQFLYRRPKFLGHFALDFTPNRRLTASLSAKMVGVRKDISFDENYNQIAVNVPKYVIFNAYGQYNIYKALSLNMKINNVLNATYYDIYGFSTLPFNAHGGFTYSF